MASIKIIGIGKAQKGFSEEIQRYQKMLRPHISLSTVFLKPDSSGGPVDVVLESERKQIEKHLSPGCILLALGEEGRQFSSKEFAGYLEQTLPLGANLVFVIGGAHGLAPAVKKRAHQLISLSSMTFPHRLCWVLLAEQIYRAFTILKGHPYHKQ